MAGDPGVSSKIRALAPDGTRTHRGAVSQTGFGGTGQRVCISGGYTHPAGGLVLRSRQPPKAIPEDPIPAAPRFGPAEPGMPH